MEKSRHKALPAALSGWIVETADSAFMGLYGHARQNARRLTRLGIALLPLMMLLVGSCKVSQVSDNFAGQDKVAQLRTALFPDRAAFRGDDAYRPAGGYVLRARSFVAGDPAALASLTQKEVAYLFGKPALERRDADARVWQYRAKDCAMDVFFYDDGGDGGSPVSFIDYRIGQDLMPESARREEPVSARGRSKCLRRIANGDFVSFSG